MSHLIEYTSICSVMHAMLIHLNSMNSINLILQERKQGGEEGVLHRRCTSDC